MSVAGIVCSGLSHLATIQRNYQQVRSEFKQLGQDLQAGNLTQAQTDFVTLSQSMTTQLSSNSPMGKALNSLGAALQAGDLSAAREAFASFPVAVVGPTAVHHSSQLAPAQSAFSQALSQLGQALQGGDLSAAQQAFAAVQQVWQQMGTSDTTIANGTTETTANGALSVTV